jgi:pimeloyl-ACP methyl ester carboxylesterase
VALAAACAPAAPPDYARVPVLLVHGLGDDGRVWDALRARLVRDGYPAAYVLAVRLDPVNGSSVAAATAQLPRWADSLRAAAAAAAAAHGAPPPDTARLDIVAHSMGAVAARWYAVFVAPSRVRTLVSLAGANHGTSAVCDWPGAGAAELCDAARGEGPLVPLVGSDAQPVDETPFGDAPDAAGRPRVPPSDSAAIAWHVAWVPADEWIVPEASARLDGADATHRIEGHGHDALIRSGAAADLVLRALRGDPRR